MIWKIGGRGAIIAILEVVRVCEYTEESAGYLRGLVIQFPTLTTGHPVQHANVCMYV